MAQPQSIEHQLSEEDHQLVTTNELGCPIAIYKLRPLCLYLWGIGGIFLLILGISEMLSIFIAISKRWYETRPDSIIVLVMLIGVSIFSFLAGLFALCIELPRSQKQHIVACEQGLFQIVQRSRNKQISVIYWRDILLIKRLYNGYYILYQGGETFTIDILYRRVGELITLIKIRSGRI